MQLNHDEFVQCFTQHILPHRLVRIRHYRILSASWKRGRLQALQLVRKELPVKNLLRKCPCCKTGKLININVFGKRGTPQKYFVESKPVPVSYQRVRVILCQHEHPIAKYTRNLSPYNTPQKKAGLLPAYKASTVRTISP